MASSEPLAFSEWRSDDLPYLVWEWESALSFGKMNRFPATSTTERRASRASTASLPTAGPAAARSCPFGAARRRIEPSGLDAGRGAGHAGRLYHDLDAGIRGQHVGHDLADDDGIVDDHHPDRVHA